MKLKNKSALSIVLALGLTLIMVLLVLYILAYIIPYSRSVKGIEHSSNAFLQAESSIEDALFFINKERVNLTQEENPAYPVTSQGYKYSTTSRGSIIPPTGLGNSDFDKDYNTLSFGNPIQLEIGRGIIPLNGWDTIQFNFEVPPVDGSSYDLSGGTGAVVAWQIKAGGSDTLNPDQSWLVADNITYLGFSSNMFGNGGLYEDGIDLSGSGITVTDFYERECRGAGSGCLLKIGVVGVLETATSPIPYLEYKIDFNTEVPLRYTRINSDGKSYGFQKSLEVKVPQQTSIEIFDFTVIQ